MNEKLKSILHNAWTEPRHFFFWLAVLSLSGFVAVATGTSLRRPGLFLAFLALGFSLCFLVSVAAFILAWIPPLRRMLGLLLARRFLVLAGLVTLIALFYAVENWRGHRAWQSFKHQREAQGEQFDFASLALPAVPPEQNFFETPLWNDLHFARTGDTTIWSDTNWGNHVVFNAFGPNGVNAPSPGNWTKAQRVDLAAWQAFYHSTNNVFPAENGQRTNYFPVATGPQSPAADVLLALSRFNTNRQLLIVAAARPHARFWANYEDGPAMLLPHLARLKATVQYLSLQANAALKAGDKETTIENLKLIFRLLDSIRGEPILISHLVRIASLQIGLQSIWEGLADRQWTEAELAQIEGELGKLDFLADYHFAMRGEQACNVWSVDYVRKTGIAGWEQLAGSEPEGSGPPELEKFLSIAIFRLIPAGWFDQNKLSTCRIHEKYLFPPVDKERHIVSSALVKQSEAAFRQRKWGPYDILLRILMPSYSRAAERFARGQASVDLARLACALERCRLANGQFPDTLEALSPQFIAKVPADLINGQPLKYRRTTDGQFLLYSVGWNGADDGGEIVFTKQGGPDMDRGDWVWPNSAAMLQKPTVAGAGANSLITEASYAVFTVSKKASRFARGAEYGTSQPDEIMKLR
jgi:hypothetical protein